MANRRKKNAEQKLLASADQPYDRKNQVEVEVQRTNIGIPKDIHSTIRVIALQSKGKHTMNSIIVDALNIWLLQNDVKPEVIKHG